MVNDKTVKNFALGGLTGQAWDLTVGGPIIATAFPGRIIPAVNIRDKDGNWVWGLGAGDITTFAAGAAIAAYGQYKHKADWKNFGLGWLITMGLVKVAELGYIINKRTNTLGGWEPSWTIPLQAQLVVGSKPNVSAPECAGSHAADQQLFI